MKNYALQNINLKIPICSKIAFVGKTGSGKTILQIKYCLLRPTSGGLYIDNKEIKTLMYLIGNLYVLMFHNQLIF